MVVRCAVGVVIVLIFALVAREFPALAVLVILVAGLAGLVYLVTRHRGMAPDEPEQERGKHERFLRDVPRPSGSA